MDSSSLRAMLDCSEFVDVEDPFAMQSRSRHPALKDNRIVGPEIDTDIFRDFFGSAQFLAWSSGKKSWQLHCHGEPGCGKTTVAAVAVNRICEGAIGDGIQIASISITQYVASVSLDFVEDILRFVHEQIGTNSSDEYKLYQTVYDQGQPRSLRIKKLMDALRCTVQSTPTFLILDGYDNINEVLQRALDFELSTLQIRGLKIMLTRRVPAFSISFGANCDNCGAEYLDLWWQCLGCREQGDYFWLCNSCDKGDHDCANPNFEEVYDHVDLKLGNFPLENFIAAHIRTSFPQVSERICAKITEYIETKTSGHITLTLLYLQDMLQDKPPESFDAGHVDDRLPTGVIDFFDAEVKSFGQLGEIQRATALLAIVATATTNHPHGLPLKELELMLRKTMSATGDMSPPSTSEDLMKCANGWLVDLCSEGQEIDVSCKRTFALYVQEDYNDWFALAKQHLRDDGDAKATASGLPPHTETDAFGISVVQQERSESSSENRSIAAHDAQPNEDIRSPVLPPSEQRMVQSPRRMDSEFTSGDAVTLFPSRLTSQDNTKRLFKYKKEVKRRICNSCEKNILQSRKLKGSHQLRHDDSQNPEQNCLFCTTLYDDRTTILRRRSRDVSVPYNWMLRKSAYRHGAQSSVILTFKSIGSNPTQRSFHILNKETSDIPALEEIPPSTNPDESYGIQIKEWISTCNDHHHSCSRSMKNTFVPTRLLDVQTGNPSMIRLVDTAVSKVKGPYCTLSHSWGLKPFLTTDVWNMAEFLITGIGINRLPKNFTQAIEVVRLLDIKYIWIDSLCIVQNPKGDFAKEGDLMHKVYRHSYCNIVATDSADGYGGLFRKRDANDDVLSPSFESDGTNPLLERGSWVVVPANLWENELLGSFIYSRGWVFQERMLSPRILHFARKQIFWDCSTLSACETFPKGLPQSIDGVAATDRHWRGRLDSRQHSGSNHFSGAIDNESPYTFWMSAVQNYTRCNLTSQGDKTVAIWSIAKVLRDMMEEDYAVGMWSLNLEEQLAWRVQDFMSCERMPELQFAIPSWAWASVKGPITLPRRLTARDYWVTNHNGGKISMNVEKTEDLDKEPVLDDSVLAISGHINVGELVETKGGHEIRVQMGENTWLQFNAFFDEIPQKHQPESGYRCVILAASQENSSNHHSDERHPVTFNGVGIILVKRKVWVDDQRTALRAIESEQSRGESMSIASKIRLEYLRKIFLEKPKSNYPEESLYRRVGSFTFGEMEKNAYSWLQRGNPCKIWLQ